MFARSWQFFLLGFGLLLAPPLEAQPWRPVAAVPCPTKPIVIPNWPARAIDPLGLPARMQFPSAAPADDNLYRPPRLQLLGRPTLSGNDPVDADSPHDLGPDQQTIENQDLGLQVDMGEDNLFFDSPRRQQAGGAGFWKVQSLWQLVDLDSTSLCLGMKAITPAGPETGGVDSGPTVLSPSLAWVHDLGEGMAVHGFVGQQIQANSRWREYLGADLQCGMALHYPLLARDGSAVQGLYFFLHALGRLNQEPDRAGEKAPAWEVVPGLYWRMNERCWLSMGGSRQGQITCSWKY